MIISCPQCDMRYDVPTAAFSDGSRKMKCASCAHVWVQDEVLEKNEAPFKGMLDRARQSSTDKQGTDKNKNQTNLKWKQTMLSDLKDGLFVIIIACAVIVGGYVGWSLMSPSLIYGQGLAFDNITIARHGDTIQLKGEIVNSMKDTRGIPAMEITHMLNHDVRGDRILITPDINMLEGGASTPIDMTLSHVGDDVQSIHITFTTEATDTNEGDAASLPDHHEPDHDDQDHQSDSHGDEEKHH